MKHHPHFGRKPRSAKKAARQARAPARLSPDVYSLLGEASHISRKDAVILQWEAKSGRKLSHDQKDRYFGQAELSHYTRKSIPRARGVAGIASRIFVTLTNELNMIDAFGAKHGSFSPRALFRVVKQVHRGVLHRRDVIEYLHRRLYRAHQKGFVATNRYQKILAFLNFWSKKVSAPVK